MMQSLFSEYFLPVTLAIITLGMGLSLTDKDFRNIFMHPKAVIIGLCSQMILLPLIAWLIVRSIDIDPIFKVGLMIIAACPGGATSNLITYLLRGNVALSISMTALNSILTLITIPLVVHLSLEVFYHENTAIRLDVGMTIIKVFLHDLGELTDLYRVASLVGLAVSLIVVSLLYQRFVFTDRPTSDTGGD